jgi:hypothetical protein
VKDKLERKLRLHKAEIVYIFSALVAAREFLNISIPYSKYVFLGLAGVAAYAASLKEPVVLPKRTVPQPPRRVLREDEDIRPVRSSSTAVKLFEAVSAEQLSKPVFDPEQVRQYEQHKKSEIPDLSVPSPRPILRGSVRKLREQQESQLKSVRHNGGSDDDQM